MRRPLFVGDVELNEAYRQVGMVISSCARLEQAIAYLEWQLKAFSSADSTASLADRQAKLRLEREAWDKYATLEQRLGSATAAFNATVVATRVRKEPKLIQMRQQWESLRERARALGKKRNEIGHTFLSWSDGKVIREVGRPWSEKVVVSESESQAFVSEIATLEIEIGRFTTELGRLLPFADDDQIITI